jgi:hypothetical protein
VLSDGGVIAFQAAAILGHNAGVDTKQCESARELAATYGHDAVCKLLESHHNVSTGSLEGVLGARIRTSITSKLGIEIR